MSKNAKKSEHVSSHSDLHSAAKSRHDLVRVYDQNCDSKPENIR